MSPWGCASVSPPLPQCCPAGAEEEKPGEQEGPESSGEGPQRASFAAAAGTRGAYTQLLASGPVRPLLSSLPPSHSAWSPFPKGRGLRAAWAWLPDRHPGHLRSLREGALPLLPQSPSIELPPSLDPEPPLEAWEPLSPQHSFSPKRRSYPWISGYGALWSMPCRRCCGAGKTLLPTFPTSVTS